MKVMYIDIETTGLDHDHDDVLEIGCVIDDLATPLNALPQFHCYVVKDRYSGNPFALALNAQILLRIANKERHPEYKFLAPENVAADLTYWLDNQNMDKKITVGGKNVAGFDMKFLSHLLGFERQGGGLLVGGYSFRARVIDPAILYWNPFKDDSVPALNECCNRAGIAKQTDHTAIGDCLLVAQLVRRYVDKSGWEWLGRATT